MVRHYKPKKAVGRKFGATKRNASKAGYDKDWRIYRFRFLHHNPYCYCCPAKATVVDHIRAHKGDVELFQNTSNHLPLCKTCHDYVTGKFDSYKEPKTEEKCQWFTQRRKELNLTHAVKVLKEYIKER